MGDQKNSLRSFNVGFLRHKQEGLNKNKQERQLGPLLLHNLGHFILKQSMAYNGHWMFIKSYKIMFDLIGLPEKFRQSL
jgi:hypothetical protein